VIAAHYYADTPTLIDAVHLHTAELTRAELVQVLASLAGLTAGVVQTRRAQREAATSADGLNSGD
jgi:hypothetical protein